MKKAISVGFRVTLSENFTIKGRKSEISIYIKSIQIKHEKKGLKVSFLINFVLRSFKVTKGQKLAILGQISIFIKYREIGH